MEGPKPAILCEHFDDETGFCELGLAVPDDCYGDGIVIKCTRYSDINHVHFATITDPVERHRTIARGYRYAADRVMNRIEQFKRDMDVEIAGLFLYHGDEERLLTIVHKCKLELQQIPIAVHALASKIEQS